ncbi:hypothetical protein N9Y19_00575 [Porticoccaceae bacterium]|jgi:hypothetical protein|nr:hypothetical protein [Porticoccaceae bacterium]
MKLNIFTPIVFSLLLISTITSSLSACSSSSSLTDLEAAKKEGANAARKQAKEAFEKLD